jgi:hypothetical protein
MIGWGRCGKKRIEKEFAHKTCERCFSDSSKKKVLLADRVCVGCGVVFTPKTHRQLFHNKQCTAQYHKVKRRKPKIKKACLYCEASFETAYKKQVFCLPKCRNDYKHNITDPKTRVFSDITLTLVAAAELKGESLDKMMAMFKWRADRFDQQLKINRKNVDIRKRQIERWQAMIWK